jgi:16S rRNA (cytosine967-C5)-methyltransferase
VLRFQNQLDWLIAHYSGRPDPHLHPPVRRALRLGIYQLRYMDRIPPHAAVGESVELVKQSGKRSAAGLVNAVLRKTGREPVEWPDRATALSHPEWMLERWERQFGASGMEALAAANRRQPETYVRIGPNEPPVAGAEPTAVAGCFRLRSGAREGLRIQDIGSQSIVPLLALERGHRFLDLCAAPGNKTAQALEVGIRAVACDVYMPRLAAMRRFPAALVRLDATRPLPFGRVFDRVLVDAPCSGTGTLARNPEIKWRLAPSDICDLAEKQKSILRHALAALAPGGRLVYSTCSLEREENEGVVESVADAQVIETLYRIPGRDEGDGFFAAVIKSD